MGRGLVSGLPRSRYESEGVVTDVFYPDRCPLGQMLRDTLLRTIRAEQKLTRTDGYIPIPAHLAPLSMSFTIMAFAAPTANETPTLLVLILALVPVFVSSSSAFPQAYNLDVCMTKSNTFGLTIQHALYLHRIPHAR